MTWAIADPKGLGDFFPAGEYVGWKEAVHAYFFNEMSDEEKRAMRPDMVLDYYEFAKKFSGNDGPLVPANCPSEYRMKKRHGSLASLLLMTNRLRAVDAA